MKELGFYDLHNDFSINIDTELCEADSTMFHEMTHMSVTLQSGYGNFLTLLERGCTLYPKYSYVKHFFMKHMLKLQEAISTFAELVLTYSVKGVNGLKKRIEELEFNNKKYYKYTYPLFFLFSFVDSDYSHDPKPRYIVPRERLLGFIFNIAIEALNVDLSSVYSVDILKTKKSLEKTENNPLYSSLFPNKRFYKAIHVLAKQLHLVASQNYSDESFESITSNVNSIVFGSVAGFSSQTSRLQTYLDKNKKLVKSLFSEAYDYYTIYQNIDQIEIREIPIDRLRAYAMPSSPFRHFAFDEMNISTATDFRMLHIDAFFILGDNTAIHDTFDNHLRGVGKLIEESDTISQNIISLNRVFPLLKLNSKYIIMNAYNYPNRIMYGACLDKAELHRLNNDIPIIVNYKYYDRFRRINLPNKHIYYYCDRVYENAIGLFNSLPNVNAMKYAFLQYDGSLSVFAVKLKKSVFYFLPIVTPLIYLILEDMQTGKLSFKKENLLELSDSEISEFDAVINCLYCTPPNTFT